MRINADKPTGNSDYYFQHITMREGSRKGETGRDGMGREKKSKSQREPHGAHNHLHGGDRENTRNPKVSQGGG